MNRQYKKIAMLFILVSLAGMACKKNYEDPSRAPEDEAFSTSRGLTGVAIGLQRVYTLGRASSTYNRITSDAFVTYQFNILNQGNTAEYQLFLGGGSVDGTNTIIAGLWTSSNKILYDAEKILANVDAVVPDKGYASGLIGDTTIFKVLALADLASFWDKVPAGIGV